MNFRQASFINIQQSELGGNSVEPLTVEFCFHFSRMKTIIVGSQRSAIGTKVLPATEAPAGLLVPLVLR